MPSRTRRLSSLPQGKGYRRAKEQNISEGSQRQGDDNPHAGGPFFVLRNGIASAGERESQHSRDSAPHGQNRNADGQCGDYPEIPRQRILVQGRRRALAIEK